MAHKHTPPLPTVRMTEIDDSGELLNIVDEIGHAIGVTYEEGEPLRAGRKEEERDEHRWELNPASAEDYGQRSAAAGASEPILRMKHRDQYRRSGPEAS